jgi:hypothetical protein
VDDGACSPRCPTRRRIADPSESSFILEHDLQREAAFLRFLKSLFHEWGKKIL